MSKPPRLFHATCATAKEDGVLNVFPDILEPRRQKTVLGEEGDFVFAGASLPLALTYALKTRNGEPNSACVDASRLTQEGIPIAMMFGYEFLDQHPEGRIFEVPGETFHAVTTPDGNLTGEWVSKEPVTPTFLKSVSLNFAMRAGVQIFVHTSRNSRNIYRKELNEVFEEKDPLLQERAYFDMLKSLIERGELVHLNRERGMNPVNFDNLQLEDDSFIRNPEKIHEVPTTPGSIRSTRLKPQTLEKEKP